VESVGLKLESSLAAESKVLVFLRPAKGDINMKQKREKLSILLIITLGILIFTPSDATSLGISSLNEVTSLGLFENKPENTQQSEKPKFIAFLYNQKKIHLPESIRQNLSKGKEQVAIVVLENSDAFQSFSKRNYVKQPHLDKRAALDDYGNHLKKVRQEFVEFSIDANVEISRSYQYLPMALVNIPNDIALEALTKSPKVKGIYENEMMSLFLNESLPLINQPEASILGAQGEGTTVAIVDTGVDYTRAEFGSCTSPGVPSACKVVHAQDFAPDDLKLDAHGHGTNVAGISLGVAPSTKIAALDVFSGNGAYWDDILAALDWVVVNQATYNIVSVNLSLGSSIRNTSPCVDSIAVEPFSRLRSVIPACL